MEKTVFNIMMDVEIQAVELERAYILLDEASNHLDDVIQENTWRATHFIRHTIPTLRVLVDLSRRLIQEALPELNASTAGLLEIHKNENEKEKNDE